ncbi:MAG: hypothetical protein PHE54_05600, partial [Bacilli bacterium]|nr:hypothetical protein [Bacilli bacterium]
NQVKLYEKMLIIFSRIQIEINNLINTKDRSNHLHHALDACIIAVADEKMTFRLQNFAKTRETFYNEETGEINTKIKLEKPYEEYRNEVIYRVYERDDEVLKEKLSKLANYKNVDLKNDVQVLYPSRSVNKNITGPFTKETLFGYRDGKIITRVSVDKLTENDLEKILNISNGSNTLIDAVKKWFKESKDKRSKYPILPGKGNYIKKVTLVESDDIRRRVNVKGNVYAQNDNCIRVDVYKRKDGQQGYYMVPVYYFQKIKEKQNKEVFYEIMWKRGDQGRDYLTQKQIDEKFDLVCRLPRFSLIELELVNGARGICYTGGATTGKFEIYSVLGDNFDLMYSQLITTPLNQIQKTISQIKNIKVRNISILGKLN